MLHYSGLPPIQGTPFEQQEHELLENLLESADATVKSSYMAPRGGHQVKGEATEEAQAARGGW